MSSSKPTLSVFLPNYNHGRHIHKALEAILSQSYLPKEILVIDDGSTDDSVSVIRRFVEKSPLIRFERNERNIGVFETHRRWWGSLSGDYVFHATSDDRVLPGHFQKSMELLARYPEAGFCSSLAMVEDPEGSEPRPLATPIVRSAPGYLSPAETREAYRRYGTWVVPHSVVFRREAFLETEGFNPELTGSADNLLYRVLSAKHGSCYIPERLILWRPAVGSISWSSCDTLDKAVAMFQLLEKEMRTTYGALFTEEDIAAMRRPVLGGFVNSFLERPAGRYEDVLAVSRAFGNGFWPDRLFRGAWRVYLQIGWLGLKLYHFVLQSPVEQRRLLTLKMRKLSGGRA